MRLLLVTFLSVLLTGCQQESAFEDQEVLNLYDIESYDIDGQKISEITVSLEIDGVREEWESFELEGEDVRACFQFGIAGQLMQLGILGQRMSQRTTYRPDLFSRGRVRTINPGRIEKPDEYLIKEARSSTPARQVKLIIRAK